MPSPRQIAAGATFSQPVAIPAVCPTAPPQHCSTSRRPTPARRGHLMPSRLHHTNSAILPIGANSRVNLYPNATTDVGVIGYFAPGGKSYLLPVSPLRRFDTRTGLGGSTGALAGRSTTQCDAVDWHSSDAPPPPRTSNYRCCSTRSPCCAGPILACGRTGPTRSLPSTATAAVTATDPDARLVADCVPTCCGRTSGSAGVVRTGSRRPPPGGMRPLVPRLFTSVTGIRRFCSRV